MKKIYALCLAFLGFAGFVVAQPTVIPASDELILPQYAYYGGTSAVHRMPFVCRLTLTGLTPGATYRYFTGMSSNGNATVQTPGAMYRINNGQNPTYGHITGYAANKAIAGSEIQNDQMITTFGSGDSRHCRFTADGSGNYTGWFACVPVNGQTSNVPVQTIGSDVYFYVQIDNGTLSGGLAKSYRTTSTIKLLNYTNVPGDANGGTPLIGRSDVGSEKMVVIYDNTAATGRPLYCTFTENNNQGGNLEESTIWTNPVIYKAVDGVSGSWAAIIPNTLTGGVKAINFHNINDASLITLSNSPAANTSADGVWNGVSTANPAGDSTQAIVINSIQGSGPLPVTLLNFKGVTAKEGVKLIWSTSQEINNRHFDIMRAGRDGKFQAIGRVNAVDIPGLLNEYSFIDRQPINGVNYYQLKQVDKDGSVNISNTVYVNAGQANKGMRLISASSAEIAVGIYANENNSGTILFTDVQGRVLHQRSIALQQGENIVRIPDAGAAKGVGVISFISSSSERMNLKVLW